MSLVLDQATVVRGARAILREASVHCAAGRFTALCGPNGAGKTTALSLAAGTLAPDRGAAMIDGRNIADLRADDLARRRAVVAQASVLSFPFEAHEVVAMGRAPHHGRVTPARDHEIVAAAIDLMALAPLAARNFLTLSGGERQRVHIARALAQIWDPPKTDVDEEAGARWLLLDEPTAALDLKHQIALMRLLKRLAREGWGVAAILHDLHLVRQYTDDVVLFRDGRVAGAGPVADTLTAGIVQDVFDLAEPYALIQSAEVQAAEDAAADD